MIWVEIVAAGMGLAAGLLGVVSALISRSKRHKHHHRGAERTNGDSEGAHSR